MAQPMIHTVSSDTPTQSLSLIAAHSHIRGLGIDADTLEPKSSAQGLVGQQRARKAAAIILRMVIRGREDSRVGELERY